MVRPIAPSSSDVDMLSVFSLPLLTVLTFCISIVCLSLIISIGFSVVFFFAFIFGRSCGMRFALVVHHLLLGLRVREELVIVVAMQHCPTCRPAHILAALLASKHGESLIALIRFEFSKSCLAHLAADLFRVADGHAELMLVPTTPVAAAMRDFYCDSKDDAGGY